MFRILLIAAFATSLWAAAPDGAELYKARCAVCHDGKPQPRMPAREELTAKAPEYVYKVMSEGAMMVQASGLNEEERLTIARYITGKAFAAVQTQPMAGQCTPPAKTVALADGDLNRWGARNRHPH